MFCGNCWCCVNSFPDKELMTVRMTPMMTHFEFVCEDARFATQIHDGVQNGTGYEAEAWD